MTDKQSILAYLGQVVLLLRRRAIKPTTPNKEAVDLSKFAAKIQRLSKSIEERIA